MGVGVLDDVFNLLRVQRIPDSVHIISAALSPLWICVWEVIRHSRLRDYLTINVLDPTLIIGWDVDGFDLRHLQQLLLVLEDLPIVTGS